MFTDVTDETINEQKTKFETFNNGAKVGSVDLEVQVCNGNFFFYTEFVTIFSTPETFFFCIQNLF